MQIPLVWVYLALGVAAGAAVTGVIAFVIFRRHRQACLQRLDSLRAEAENTRLEARRRTQELEARNSELEAHLAQNRIENAALRERTGRIAELEELLEAAETARELERERLLARERELAELKARSEAERQNTRERLAELKETRETMQKEFRALASQILEENGHRFGRISQERVEEVLRPLRQQVNDFKKRVEEVHTEETRELATLMSEIRHLRELNLKIGEEALQLTRALRGESKTRGIWGEMVLERVLEASGLREGREYEREATRRGSDRRRYRPDVIVHLPDNRDIVIDAKTSLVAYERYVNAEEEEERTRFARMHLEAVRRHIDSLAEKGYTRLEGVNTLDFVFLFMPVEGALMLALQSDPKLYDYAFGRGIVLVSPTTLLVALRAVENSWRHDRQNKNALLIAQKAGDLYDKFVGFAEDLERVGRQLETLQNSYDNAWKKLADGRGNLVRRIEELRLLGARTGKSMPDKIAREAELDQLAEERAANTSST